MAEDIKSGGGNARMSARVKVAFVFGFLAWAIGSNEDLPLWTLIPSAALMAQACRMVWIELKEAGGR